MFDGCLEHVERALHVDVDRLERELPRVHDHGRRLVGHVLRFVAFENCVEDPIVGDVTNLENGRARLQVAGDVFELAVVKVVDDDHEMAEIDELIDDEGADVAGAPGHQDSCQNQPP